MFIVYKPYDSQITKFKYRFYFLENRMKTGITVRRIVKKKSLLRNNVMMEKKNITNAQMEQRFLNVYVKMRNGSV